jgi:phosphohistidine phosphatase
MKLYLIRHAPAEPRGGPGEDAARQLSKKGRKRWARAARGLDRLGVRFDSVVHSPMLRAVDTAEEILRRCAGVSAVSARLAEAPGIELLAEISGECVALVGHEPWLSELAGLLVLGAPAQGSRILLKKGSVLCLDGELRPGGMQVTALLPMKVLAAI